MNTQTIHASYTGRREAIQTHEVDNALWAHLLDPGVFASCVVLLVAIIYHSAFGSTLIHLLGHGLWKLTVTTVPARVLYAIDDWRNPTIFPRHMLPQSHTYAAKSDALQRIFGIDGASGIMSSIINTANQSTTRLTTSGAMRSSNNDQPPGLGNRDNSCYQNSILQALASLQTLPRYLSWPSSESDVPPNTYMQSETLRRLMQALTDGSANGQTLWTPGPLRNMSTWQQQDAQEYFYRLIDEVDKEMAKVVRVLHRPTGFELQDTCDDSGRSQHSDDSGYHSTSAASKSSYDTKMARNPLEGLFAQRLACRECGYSEGLSLDPFTCLMLQLDVGGQRYDLEERLDKYTQVEAIPKVGCSKCTLVKYHRLLNEIIERNRNEGKPDEKFTAPMARLAAVEEALEEDKFDDAVLKERFKMSPQFHVNSTKTKQVVLARPPQSLAIHINRSVFDERTGASWKNPAAVDFPLELDLGPWCLGSGRGGEVDPLDLDGAASDSAIEEQWASDARESLVSGGYQPSRIRGPIYELRAVITHRGHHENGHYICYRRHPCQPKQKASHDAEDADAVSTGGGQSVQDNKADNSYESAQVEQEARQTDEIKTARQAYQWWRLSDQNVQPVEEADVLSQGGVFMLFYDCIDPNPVLVSDESEQSSAATDVEPESLVWLDGSDRQQSLPPDLVSDNGSDAAHPRDAVTHGGPTLDDILALAGSVPLPLLAEEDLEFQSDAATLADTESIASESTLVS